MSDLKPCPFCGDTYISTHLTTFGKYTVGCNTLKCISLHTEGKLFNSREEAIEAWNKRVNEENE